MNMAAKPDFSQWWATNLPGYSASVTSAYAYEAVFLFANALNKMSSDGVAFTNGAALRDSLKAVSFPGIITEQVSLTSSGEMDAAYEVLNFYSGQWSPVGNMTKQDEEWVLSLREHLPGCVCSGESPSYEESPLWNGTGSTCDFFGWGAKWCYVSPSTCHDPSVLQSASWTGHYYLIGCDMGIFFTEGTHIVPPSTSFIEVTALFPLGDPGWAGGRSMLPALTAALKTATEVGLLPGFTLKVTAANSHCQAARAASTLAQMKTPHLIIGPGCSSAAAAIQPVTKLMNIPVISPSAMGITYSAERRVDDLYVRMMSITTEVFVAADIGIKLGFTRIGAFTSDDFHPGLCLTFHEDVASRGQLLGTGCLAPFKSGLSSRSLQQKSKDFEESLLQLLTYGCAYYLIWVWNPELEAIVASLDSGRFDSYGIAWAQAEAAWAGEASWSLAPLWKYPVYDHVNWLVWYPIVDMDHRMYKKMAEAVVNASYSPDAYSIATWNAGMAAALALDDLITSPEQRGQPSLYPTHPEFGIQFLEAVNRVHNTSLGAGYPIQFNRFNAFCSYNVMSVQGYQNLTHVGQWTFENNFHSTKYPFSAPVLQPVQVDCPIGQINVDPYNCENCPPGRYAEAVGSKDCVQCAIGKYSAGAAGQCIGCMGGATTKQKGSTHIDDCWCEPGSYQPSAEQSTEPVCAPCPSGATCLGGSFKAIKTKPNHWAPYPWPSVIPSSLPACTQSDACAGGTNSSCYTGYTGISFFHRFGA